ncbi:hypothetical protein PG999_010475 [Apiospora kogelbergensis]|uniref:Uncharacterized protein n=1 Tax=Apiospora kogelbergensis TaxID=1337665 RepID=A0AAW0QL52_9PEZI
MEEFTAQAQALAAQMRRLTRIAASSPSHEATMQFFDLMADKVTKMHETLVNSHATVEAERQAFAELPQKQAELAENQRNFQARLDNLVTREQEVTAQEGDVARQKEEVANREADVDARKAALDRREEVLDSWDTRNGERAVRLQTDQDTADNVLQRDGEVSGREDDITRREGDVTRREGNITRHAGVVGRLEARARQTSDDLERQRRQLEFREQGATAAEVNVSNREAQVLASAEAQERSLRDGLENIAARLDGVRLTEDCFRLRRELQEKQRDLDEAEAQIAQLNARLDHRTLNEENGDHEYLHHEVQQLEGDNARLQQDVQKLEDESTRLKHDLEVSSQTLEEKTNELLAEQRLREEADLREFHGQFNELQAQLEDPEVRWHLSGPREVAETPEPCLVASASSPELGSKPLALASEPGEPSEPGEASNPAQASEPAQADAPGGDGDEPLPGTLRRRLPPRQADYTPWGRFCDRMHNFLYHHRMVLEPVSAQASGLTVDQAGEYLMHVANRDRAQGHLCDFRDEADPHDWYCFKRVVEWGYAATGARLDAERCQEHPNNGDRCLQIMKGANYGELLVQLQY